MKEISVIGGQPHGHAALPLAAEVFLCGAHFRGTQPIRAPHSPFLQEPYGKWGARAQKRGFACAENKICSRKSRQKRCLRFAVTIRRKQCSGESPRRCFLLLWRIFGASPVKECAKFILFRYAIHMAQGEKAKSAIFAFSVYFWKDFCKVFNRA